VRVELYQLVEGGERRLIADVATNADGRTDRPLIGVGDARAGRFELVFHAGDYFRRQGVKTADPPFLDLIPIRFAIADPQAHYHVPLLVSPWSYSTYRGS
jgi:5-hydroxyisourate hydrolase